VSTQALPHGVSPPEQPVTHVVPLQSAVGAVHTTPHCPQLLGLDFGVSHPGLPALQSRCVAAHWHPAGPHTMLGPQITPHALQLVVVASDASQPSAGLPLQSANPGAHAQAPPMHTCCGPQGWLQPPQFWGSVAGSTSHPLAAIPSQSRRPAGHWHAPATHAAPAGQARKHPPQWSGLVSGSASQPLSPL
jgi:hypothetical protein